MESDKNPNRVSRALVLAAGNGKRLLDSKPKPLIPLLGLPLLARTLFSLERAGITDAYIVIGYRGDEIRKRMEREKRFRIRLHWLRNERWRDPNGLSVLCAENVLTGFFILAMSDHVFDPDAITRLQPGNIPPDGIRMLVDYDIPGVFDLEDATKVKVSDGRVRRIRKDLVDFNAADAGFFLAGPSLFQAIREAGRENKWALSDGVQKLAECGRVEAVDIQGRMWQDIDTREHAREAERRLLASLVKPSDGSVSRHLNRPVSLATSRLLARTPIGPHLVTLLNMLLGLTAAGIAARGGYLPFLLAAFLFQLNSIFDGTDGELARLKFMESKHGEWLDTIADNIVYLALILGYTMGMKNAGLPDFYSYAGFAGLVFGIAMFISMYTYLVRCKKAGTLLEVKFGQENWDPRLRLIAVNLGKRDFVALLLLGMALVGWAPGLVFYVAGFSLIMLFLTLRLHAALSRKRAMNKRRVSFSTD